MRRIVAVSTDGTQICIALQGAWNKKTAENSYLVVSGVIRTADSEVQITALVARRSATSSIASSLSKLVPVLSTAIEDETASAEEKFQAQTCLEWLQWLMGEPALSVPGSPADFAGAVEKFGDGGASLLGWTYVCTVRRAYVLGRYALLLEIAYSCPRLNLRRCCTREQR